MRSAVEASRFTALRAPLAVALAAGAATAYLAAVDPHEAGHYPTCPSLWLTGWFCPGCGSLRAVHDMAHLNFLGAIDMNPFAVVGAVWLVWRWAWWVAAGFGYERRARPAPAWVIYGVLGAVLVFWVARNIGPLAPYLAP